MKLVDVSITVGDLTQGKFPSRGENQPAIPIFPLNEKRFTDCYLRCVQQNQSVDCRFSLTYAESCDT